MKLRRTLIDNSPEGYNMTEVLKECLKDKHITEVYIATGFWDLRGTALVYDELAEFLSREGSKFRLLIGKDPYLYKSDTESFTKGRYDKQEQTWRVDLDKFAAQEQYVKVVQMLVDNLKDKDSEKFQIHIYRPEGELKDQFLHSKCYIFKGYDHEEECRVGYGIIGSTNFTQRGMEGNSELNTLEVNARDVVSLDTEFGKDKTHLLWFNEKWEDSVSWEEEFLLQVTQSKMGPVITIPNPEPEEDVNAPLTPYELYIKLLQTKFGTIVDKTLGEQIEQYLPEKYDTYDYQIDAVKQCFSTMKEHGGFMLADVVGLGKTIVGTLLIKHFLQSPDEDGREQKVLIVTPPAIQSAWQRTVDEFEEDSELKFSHLIDYITTGSIGKLTDDELETEEDENHDSGDFNEELKHENYGLIIIDESHKFRTRNTSMYDAIDTLIANIGSDTGVYPYVGLLSATPQNNRPSDLQNQIYLFERDVNTSTLKKAKGGNLESFFADVNKQYANIMHPKDENGKPITLSIEETNRLLKELSIQIRDCVLSDIMVRRTRTDVQKYYAKDKEHQNMHFPMIKGPISLQYKMSPTLARLFSDSMMNIAPSSEDTEGLRYYRYRAIQYLKNEADKQKYRGKGSRDADKVSEQLANIMQIGLVKRLESSFTAFKQSLLNLRQYTQNMIDMWEHDCIFICPRININAELDRKQKELKRKHKVSLAECFDDIRAKIEKLDKDGVNSDKSNHEYHRADFDARYIDLLRCDLEIIDDLYNRWSMNSEDPKFDVFKEELKPTLFAAESNEPQKLVVFTEAIDTAKTIATAAESKGFRVLLITAENRDKMEQTIRENFDANYGNNPRKPHEQRRNDYDIIVTTDVLAEGINLHRANCILNYDTPWNSTRLMQRIGRVNRIGSASDNVYVYNFMPSAQGDAEINLVQKAHNKLQSFHTLFGEDAQVFTDTEEVAHYDLNTEVNGEESPMEKYVFELKQFKEQHPQRYAFIEQATEGLELATVSADGTAYFLVRTPRMSGMFVEVEPTADEGKVISLADGLEAFRTTVDATAVDLPSDWETLRKEAERVVVAQLASVRVMRSNSKKATDAKGAIIDLKSSQAMSVESKKLLNAADKLIRRGNNDMVKRILKLAEEVKKKNVLFPLTQEQFDAYLSEGIAKFVANAKDKIGEPQIILGTYK